MNDHAMNYESKIKYTLTYSVKFPSGVSKHTITGVSGAMFNGDMIKVWYPEGALSAVTFGVFGVITYFTLLAED